MTHERALVVFSLDRQRYAIPLEKIQRAIRVVALTLLPRAPSIVLGIVDLGGMVLPVLNLRERFHHPSRAIRLSDHLLIARAGMRTVALLVDETTGVIEIPPESVVPSGTILPRLEFVDGAVKGEDGLVLIHDLERLLSLEEGAGIDLALKAATADDPGT